METSDVSVENAPSDIETETEAPVSEIKAENKPERFGWFKRLFRKKPKATVIDDEQPVSEQKIEETKTEAEPEIIPEIRTEKAEIEQPEEVPVNDIQPEQKRKRFNLFRKKQNTAPAEVEIQPEIVPETEPVKPVKKVIKQMEK